MTAMMPGHCLSWMTLMHTTVRTDPIKVAEYAATLQHSAEASEVRGVLSFEDRGNAIQVCEVGSCSPLSTRMLLGLLRFTLKEILSR